MAIASPRDRKFYDTSRWHHFSSMTMILIGVVKGSVSHFLYIGLSCLRNFPTSAEILGDADLRQLIFFLYSLTWRKLRKKNIQNVDRPESGMESTRTIWLTIVAQHSGHKNVASINNYAVASEYLQKRMASALSRGDLPLPKSPVSKF